MDIKNKNKDIIQNALKLVKNCPACATKYTIPMADVVQELNTGYLVYFSCTKCQSSLLTQVSEIPFGLIGSAMLTDLELNEVLKFKNSEKVSVDDVLEVYKKLEINN